MNNITINNQLVTYKEINSSDYKINDQTTTVKIYLEYSRELSREAQVSDTCRKIRHYNDFRNDAIANNYDPTTPQDIQDRAWRAIQKFVPSFQGKQPENVEVDNKFLEVLFKPILPDSFILQKSQDQSANHFIRSITTICLVVEMVLRKIVSGVISLGFHIYALHNKDKAAFYQLRLDLNRHRPYHVLSDKLFSLLGGY
jgi:hypothetical protein